MISSTKPAKVAAAATRLVRHASSARKHTVSSKISVQLLKDHGSLGVAGEIVRVKPSYMRSVLHINNGACYLNDGPRIAVVEKPKAVQAKVKAEPKKDQAKEKPQDRSKNAGTLSLDELSSLFNTMRTNASKRQKNIEVSLDETVEEITYSPSDIREAVPASNVFQVNENVELPITKQFLSSYIYKLSGFEVAHTAFRLASKSGPLDSITEVGEFTWYINTPEKKEIKRSIVVQE